MTATCAFDRAQRRVIRALCDPNRAYKRTAWYIHRLANGLGEDAVKALVAAGVVLEKRTRSHLNSIGYRIGPGHFYRLPPSPNAAWTRGEFLPSFIQWCALHIKDSCRLVLLAEDCCATPVSAVDLLRRSPPMFGGAT